MTQYSLTCKNESDGTGSFAVFQKAPPMTIPGNVFSLAWFARPAAPGSSVTFTWTVDYNFVWSETGVLMPGINFSATQVKAANPNGMNLIDLKVDTAGATTFSEPAQGGALGSLTIHQLSNVVPNKTSVGIGMSGAGVFAVQAEPNVTAVFTPHPNYWVMFGNFKGGDVIDIQTVTGAVEATYGGSQTTRTATLSIDNLITVV